MRRSVWVALLLGLAWSGAASALELEYYTYNAFEETVAAFQRLALVFSNSGFLVFVGIFAVGGVVIGGLSVAGKGIAGQQVNPTGWLIPIAAGLIIFRGLLLPTGVIHVYDPVRNSYQAVPDVPDFVVLIAGGLNKIERGIIEITDAASARPYSENSGSVSYSLLLNAMGGSVQSVNLERTMSRYFEDCAIPSMAVGYNGMSMQILKRGSTDLYDTYANFAHPSFYTVWYPDGVDAGLAGTCAEAWAFMSPLLSNVSTFATYRDTLCVKSGFNRNDPAQIARCEAEIAVATSLYGVAAGTSVPFLRSAVLAKSMSDAMNTSNFSIQQRRIVDRQIMAEGMGSAEAMNTWVPKLRGYMISMAVGLVPICCLLMVTPLFWKSLAFTVGVFLWVATWGITDAMSAQQASDAARIAFEEISRYGLSYESIMSTPEAAVQALGIFSKARGQALMLATVLCGSLFGFGAYALSSYAQGWQHHLDQAGERAGRMTHLPEERAAFQQSLASSLGPQAAVAGGFQTAAFASAAPVMQSAAGAGQFISQALTRGSSPAADNAAGGEIDWGSRHGGIMAMEQEATRMRESPGQAATRIAGWDRLNSAVQSTTDQQITTEKMDPVRAFQLRAARTAGNTIAANETYGYLNGESAVDAEGATNLGRLENASQLGMAATGTAQENVDRFITEHGRSMSHAQTTQDLGTAHLVGKMGAMQDAVSARGFARGLEDVSLDQLEIGSAMSHVRSAASGAAASEAGTAALFQTASTSQATELAASNLTHDVARFLGLDPRKMGDLITTQEMRQGTHVNVAVGADNKEAVLERLGSMELLSPRTIESLQHKEGFALDMTFDSNGMPVGSVLTAGSRAMVMDQTAVTEGFTAVRSDTTTTEVGHRLHASTALLDEAVLAPELLAATGGSTVLGEFDSNRLLEIAGDLSRALAHQGYSASGVATESATWRVGLGGNAGVGTGDAVPVVQAGASISGGWDRHDGDISSTNVAISIRKNEEIVREARDRVIEEYESVNGAGSSAAADQIELSRRWAADVIEHATEFKDELARETGAAMSGHDAIQDLRPKDGSAEFPKPASSLGRDRW